MTKRLNLLIAVVVLLLGTPYYWLFLDNSGWDVPAKPLRIEELRRLAASMPGTPPYAVEVEHTAYRRLPGNLMIAGAGIKRVLVGVMAFRLPVRDGRPIVIDSGFGAKLAATMDLEKFDAAAQERVNAAMRSAALILLTHEHSDHAGGFVSLADSAVFARARLNPAQISGNRWTEMLPWGGIRRPLPGLSGSAPQAVAPGVVVIPAPDSHTPGSQLIFVRLADGREFLFVGDIASFTQNWQELRGRSRLVQRWFTHDNRAEVFAWLKTIQQLKAADPGLVVVPGHDFEWLENPLNHTGIQVGFGRQIP